MGDALHYFQINNGAEVLGRVRGIRFRAQGKQRDGMTVEIATRLDWILAKLIEFVSASVGIYKIEYAIMVASSGPK